MSTPSSAGPAWISDVMAATLAWLRDCGARPSPENTPAEMWIDHVHDAVAEELE